MPANDTGKRNLLQRGKSALQGLRKLRSLVQSGEASQKDILAFLDSIIDDLPSFQALINAAEDPGRLLSMKEAAALLGCSVQVLYGKISRGTFPTDALVKSESGKRYYIKRSALLAADI